MDLYTHKWTAAALQPDSEATLTGKDTGKGKSPQWAEVQSMHIIIQFVWIEKWTNVQLLMD